MPRHPPISYIHTSTFLSLSSPERRKEAGGPNTRPKVIASLPFRRRVSTPSLKSRCARGWGRTTDDPFSCLQQQQQTHTEIIHRIRRGRESKGEKKNRSNPQSFDLLEEIFRAAYYHYFLSDQGHYSPSTLPFYLGNVRVSLWSLLNRGGSTIHTKCPQMRDTERGTARIKKKIPRRMIRDPVFFLLFCLLSIHMTSP